MMLADVSQVFGVALIVAAAIGYLGVILRRSWRGHGGCSACAHFTPTDTADTAVADPSAETKITPDQPKSSTAFVPLENLADIARRRREERAAGNDECRNI